MAPKPTSHTETIATKTTKLMRARMDRECARRGVSLSEAVREALAMWLAHPRKNGKPCNPDAL